jgi:hypothetical protein
VNNEIVSYNRRLGKYLKVFDSVHYLMINNDRKFHTRHGMHLNTNGKEYVARQIVSSIATISSKQEVEVITLNWDSVKLSDKIVENGKSISQDSCNLDEKPGELIHSFIYFISIDPTRTSQGYRTSHKL